jgi:hypothetical protein
VTSLLPKTIPGQVVFLVISNQEPTSCATNFSPSTMRSNNTMACSNREHSFTPCATMWKWLAPEQSRRKERRSQACIASMIPASRSTPPKSSIHHMYVVIPVQKLQIGTFSNYHRQSPPGLPKYAGRYDAPTGPKPVITETGEIPANIRPEYKKSQAFYSFISEWTVVGGDYHVPGEGEKPKGTYNSKEDWAKLYNGLTAIMAKPASEFA